MTETADVVIVGAGVQGASLAFHLARRGVAVVVVERETAASGASGRSSGFVRMHYDLEIESRIAWTSYAYFRDWDARVGAGSCDFVRTGFVQLVPPGHADALRANVAMHARLGVDSRLIGPADVSALLPGAVVDDVEVAAYEPDSGYADPTSTTAGFLSAARRDGARLVQGRRVSGVVVAGDRVRGVETDEGLIAAPVVVDAAGAWAGALARTAGVDAPVQAWRHDTAYFGLPSDRTTDFPVVIDDAGQVYFRPEGRELMLVGLESGNEVGGSPDRPLEGQSAATIETMVAAVCARVPWMADGTFRTAHGGQDGITPDQHAILGPAGPEGFFLDCGHSGTGFKTSPAIGASMAEWILDGRPTTVDLTPFSLDRFAAGRHLVGEHPYGPLWR
jgi:sarcosine oxidase subunit beta